MIKREMAREKSRFSFFFFTIIILLAILVPLAVVPTGLHNAFFAPKELLIVTAVALLVLLQAGRYLAGRKIEKSEATTPFWIVVIILLNLISFLYTENIYFTKVAALMNVSSLLLFYFISLYIDSQRAFRILVAICLSGLAVSTLVYLQFAGYYPVLDWGKSEAKIMGTIGNSNYLGAYLLFPFFASAGLIFLLKGRLRVGAVLFTVFLFGALLCSRARASWLGLGLSFPLFLLLIKYIHGFSVKEYVKAKPKRVLIYAVTFVLLASIIWAIAPRRFHKTMAFKNWGQTQTLELRWKYFRASMWLIKESPLLGDGLWSYRNKVYDAQAEINKKDPEYFKDYKHPKPRRVHNEYLEILNDGGIIAGGFLLIFFTLLMSHGAAIVRSRDAALRDRICAATCLSSVTGIMLAAFFFFPFRINTTLFMTVLMLGIMEGIYLRNRDLISSTGGKKVKFGGFALVLICTGLIALLWSGIYKPLKGEREYYKYKTGFAQRNAGLAEKHILKAISYDPGNSLYHFHAGRLYMDIIREPVKAEQHFEKADIDFNGDLTRWGILYAKGLLEFRTGKILDARHSFEKALYYNPMFSPAKEKLKEVESILEKHDSITIKLR